MGIAATIKIADLERIGPVEIVEDQSEPYRDDHGDFVTETLYYGRVTTDEGREIFFDTAKGSDLCWIDFKPGGLNRRKIEPILEQYGVPWVEG